MSESKIKEDKPINQNTGAVVNAASCNSLRPTKNILSLGYSQYGQCGYYEQIINVEPNPIAPVITIQSSLTYTEGDGEIILDNSSTITDVDSLNLSNISITCTGIVDGADEVLEIGGVQFPLNANLTDTCLVGGTTFNIVYTTSSHSFIIINDDVGNFSITDAQLLLRSISYNHLSSNPTEGDRVIIFTVEDPDALSYSGSITITVVAVADPSFIVDLNGVGAGINNSFTFTEQDSSTYVAPNATVTSTDLSSITIEVDGLLDGANEYIEFAALQIASNSANSTNTVTVGAITFSIQWILASTTIVATKNGGGTFTSSQAQDLLNILAYWNDTTVVTEGDRTFTITVTDGLTTSSDAIATVTVQRLQPKFRGLVFLGRSDANLLAAQGVATDGTNFWTTAGPTTNDEISKWTKSGDTYTLHSGPATNPLDVHLSWPAGQQQINSIAYHDPGDGGGARLWVGGNNYSTTPRVGYVQEYDPITLAFIRNHNTIAHWSEGGAWRPGTNEFWICYDNKVSTNWQVSKYTYASNTLTRVGEVDLTGSSFESGTHCHNGLYWYDETTLFATIHEGTRPISMEVYEYSPGGDTLTLIQKVRVPTMQCSQGFCKHPSNDTFYFAERFYPDGVAADHRVLEADYQEVVAKYGDPTVNTGSAQYTNLLAWYPLAEATGTTAKEKITGSSWNGTYSGGAWTYDNAMGWCYRLDGSSQIDLSSSILGAGRTTAMIMFWCKPEIMTDSTVLVTGNASGSNAGDWQIDINNTTNRGVDFFYDNLTTIGTANADRNGEIQLGEWTHIAVTLGVGGAKVYLNGVEKASSATTGTIGATGRLLRLGLQSTGSSAFTGMLRDFRIYSNIDTNIITAAALPNTMFNLWN